MHCELTDEQILSLAVDKYAIRSARSWAASDKWSQLQRTEEVLRGRFKSRSKKPVESMVSLAQPAFTCSCASRKLPCSHALALRLLYVDTPQVFEQGHSTEATTWHNALPKLTSQPSRQKISSTDMHKQTCEQIDSSNSTRQVDIDVKRLQAIRSGLDELELWLGDMVRNGLGTVRNRPKKEWNQTARRLVDAQASELAHDVRQMSLLPGSSPDWPEKMLILSGRLYLIVQGFRRFESLPRAVQGDLCMAVGWLPRTEAAAGEIVIDRWHVMGRQVEQVGKLYRQRVWLWGEEMNKPAHLMRIFHKKSYTGSEFTPGTVIEGRCIYYPSSVPLNAELSEHWSICQPDQPVTGHATLRESYQVWRDGKAYNPWLTHFPLMVQSARAEFDGKEWYTYDSSNIRLDLPPKFEYGWHLKALDEGQGLRLFGIWDKSNFTPLTVWHGNRWMSLHILKAQT